MYNIKERAKAQLSSKSPKQNGGPKRNVWRISEYERKDVWKVHNEQRSCRAVLLKLQMLIERWLASEGGQVHGAQRPEFPEQKVEVKERCPELGECLKMLREHLLRW